jgi:hypothetical protein
VREDDTVLLKRLPEGGLEVSRLDMLPRRLGMMLVVDVVIDDDVSFELMLMEDDAKDGVGDLPRLPTPLLPAA